MILAIQLREMSDDGIVLSRGDVRSAWIADSAFAADGGRDGGFGWVEAAIGDVGPPGSGVGGCAVGEEFDVIHFRRRWRS